MSLHHLHQIILRNLICNIENVMVLLDEIPVELLAVGQCLRLSGFICIVVREPSRLRDSQYKQNFQHGWFDLHPNPLILGKAQK